MKATRFIDFARTGTRFEIARELVRLGLRARGAHDVATAIVQVRDEADTPAPTGSLVFVDGFDLYDVPPMSAWSGKW